MNYYYPISSLIFRIWVVSGIICMAGAAVSLLRYVQISSPASLLFFAALFVSGSVFLVGGTIGYYIRALQIARRDWPVAVVEEEV